MRFRCKIIQLFFYSIDYFLSINHVCCLNWNHLPLQECPSKLRANPLLHSQRYPPIMLTHIPLVHVPGTMHSFISGIIKILGVVSIRTFWWMKFGVRLFTSRHFIPRLFTPDLFTPTFYTNWLFTTLPIQCNIRNYDFSFPVYCTII